jgi:dienelactone hydrolase
MIFYGGAVHGFTNPQDYERGIAALSYDPRADTRSWPDMRVFLDEIFAQAE